MATLAEVQRNLLFLNTGPEQIPGLICMLLSSNGRDYGPYDKVLVLFNATTSNVLFRNDSLRGLALKLVEVQAKSCDPLVKQSSFDTSSGTASVPGLTTAVFVGRK
jgi:pullulanase